MVSEATATLTVLLDHVREIPALTGDMRPRLQPATATDAASGGFGLSYDPADLVPVGAAVDGDSLSPHE